jgi:DNA-binding response OmpR family regulator
VEAQDNRVGAHRLILIVDDDAPLRTMWKIGLRFEGFNVIEAADGLEALRVIDGHPPDLVLLDLGLPHLDGAAVRQEIAAQAVCRDIPIVIVTGATGDLSHLHVPCILRKPVSVEQLIRTVHRFLRLTAAGTSS